VNAAVRKFLSEPISIRRWDVGLDTWRRYTVSRSTVVGDPHGWSTDDVMMEITIPMLMLLAELTDDGLQTAMRNVDG